MISLGGCLQEDEDGVRGAQRREGPGDTRWRAPHVADLGVRELAMTSRLVEFRGMNGTPARSPENAGYILDRSRRGLSGVLRGTAQAALR